MTHHSLTDTDPTEWTAYRLSNEAGVQGPDSVDSPGADFLIALRDAVANWWAEATEERRGTVEAGDDDWWHEATHHLADESIPLATHSRWQVFTDLCLWQDDDLAIIDDRDHLGAKVSLTDQATGILYEVAHRLTWVILTELTNEAEEAA
jgi:hypothetical protein